MNTLAILTMNDMGCELDIVCCTIVNWARLNAGWVENNATETERRIGDFATLHHCGELFPFKLDCMTRYAIEYKPGRVNFVEKRWRGPHSNTDTDLWLDAKFHPYMLLKHMTMTINFVRGDKDPFGRWALKELKVGYNVAYLMTCVWHRMNAHTAEESMSEATAGTSEESDMGRSRRLLKAKLLRQNREKKQGREKRGGVESERAESAATPYIHLALLNSSIEAGILLCGNGAHRAMMVGAFARVCGST